MMQHDVFPSIAMSSSWQMHQFFLVMGDIDQMLLHNFFQFFPPGHKFGHHMD
jgi:hypothetical protein